MWDLPGLGIKLVSPVLAGGFFTTEPPGKPPMMIAYFILYFYPDAAGIQGLDGVSWAWTTQASTPPSPAETK